MFIGGLARLDYTQVRTVFDINLYSLYCPCRRICINLDLALLEHCIVSSNVVLQGPDSAYFTVFASSYLPVHTSKISKADTVYQNLLGTPVLKVQYSVH